MKNVFYFHHGWHFKRADAFPMAEAFEKHRDAKGRMVYDPEYEERDWEQVTLPHTFNAGELFSVPIQDAGSGQTRTAAFYRNTLEIPPEHRGENVFLEFEGVRQTCYVYVNGKMAGYYEAGVGPFGFDLTPFLSPSGQNCIVIATDNTSTRNIPFCIAETPNKPDVIPGSYLLSQEEQVPENRAGVGFFWNCNDFNPTMGGISQPVKIHFKKDVYLTLPLYANLQTKGAYVYADSFDFEKRSCCLHVEAEARNMRFTPVKARLRVSVKDLKGKEITAFTSDETALPSHAAAMAETPRKISITPEDAYRWDDKTAHYVPVPEEECAPTETASVCVHTLTASAVIDQVSFWEPADPALYRVTVTLIADGEETDETVIETGFRKVEYDQDRGVLINGRPVWLRGYAQRATNEWAASGIVPQWLHDQDAVWIRESSANHIRFMHVAGQMADIRAFDRHGVVCTQPAGDKERENFGRQWDQRVELMRNVIIAYRNHPSILFWEAGNNSISREHMREMRLLKEALDPHGGRFMGCRTINTEDVLAESEYVGTMLNRHAGRFLSLHGPITETEYSREEAPRRVWDDFTPPDFDYRNKWLGKGGKKQVGRDFYDLTSEDLARANAMGYAEFFHDRMGGASGKNYYSAAAALCWTDSAQHGRQSWSENGRMSGRVDAIRVKKQSFDVFRVMQSALPEVKIIGHWNYPALTDDNYRYPIKRFNGNYWEETGEWGKRDPKHKTVYCVASYPVARVELFVNGEKIGACEKPESGFMFPFADVDVTKQGCIEAVGYDYEGKEACRDRIETAGKPAALRLTLHTAPGGLRADGSDLAYVDIEVIDERGRICPLCDERIDFELEGNALFLGGYNSGRFNGNGRNDNVIHQPFVYAECGTNRVLLQAVETAGDICLTARMDGVPDAEIRFSSVPAETGTLTRQEPAVLDGAFSAPFRSAVQDFIPSIPEADKTKYEPEKENYCKIMVNGQEPDFRGVRAVNKKGSIWGNVLCILERMKSMFPDRMDFDWDPQSGKLTLQSGGHTIIAQVGATHLLVDGQENLMDGQPYVTPEGVLVMEVNAIAPYVAGASAQFDDKIGALRITL